jgi:multidrug efflux pump subunit AcrA (membrane-fusion protein)
VIPLPREYLHERDTVWVFADGRLDIRPVNVVWRGRERVLVDDGLEDGERIVTSPLTNPVPGLRLKRADGDA